MGAGNTFYKVTEALYQFQHAPIKNLQIRLAFHFVPCMLRTKVYRPHSLTFLNETLISEWYMVNHGSKNRHQIDMYLRMIGIHAQIC